MVQCYVPVGKFVGSNRMLCHRESHSATFAKLVREAKAAMFGQPALHRLAAKAELIKLNHYTTQQTPLLASLPTTPSGSSA